MLYLFIGGIIYSVFLGIFVVCPLIGKVILLILNMYIPDPLPFLDEIIMLGSTIHNILNTIMKLQQALEYAKNHKFIACILVLGIIMLIKILFF